MKINYNNAEFVTSWFNTSRLTIQRLPEILFVGRSNVGKSSMINKLLNRKALAKTSEKPGKTISINFFDIDKKLFFVDLPGYGFAQRSKAERKNWGSLVEDYFKLERDIRIIFMLIDIRHEPSENDILMYKYLMSQNYLFAVIATKADKISNTKVNENIKSLSKVFGTEVIPFSIKNDIGQERLRHIIEDVSVPEDVPEVEKDNEKTE